MTKGGITNGKWKGENGNVGTHRMRPFASVCVRMRVAPVISPAVLCLRALVSRANIGPNNH